MVFKKGAEATKHPAGVYRGQGNDDLRGGVRCHQCVSQPLVTPTRLLELIKDPDSNRARRAMEAMVMIKIDIAAVERAADGV